MAAKGDHELSSIFSDSVPAVPEHPVAAWPRNGSPRPYQRQAITQIVPTPEGLDVRIPIKSLEDIVAARRSGRLLAKQMGCSESRVALILTAISELARNIISYAGSGEILLKRSNRGLKEALVVTASDQGPGISDVSIAYDRSMVAAGRSGLGLSGLKLCMDHFSIESRPGSGTRVTCEVHSK